MADQESMPDPHKNVISELSRYHEDNGFLSEQAIHDIAHKLELPLYKVYGVASFYPSYRFTPPPRAVVNVCRDLSCWMAGGTDRLKEVLLKMPDVEVNEVSCIGRCDMAPAGDINNRPVQLGDTEQAVIWARHPDLIEEKHPTPWKRWPTDPYDTEEDRYGAIRSCLRGEKAPDEVIQILKDSALRGLGGAGFPAGLKWQFARAEKDTPKYIVCNADESEPGTFKDREIISTAPYLTLEGMLLAAWVAGAEDGYFYIRHEYHIEEHAMRAAIEDAYRRGMLGKNILGTDFNFDVTIFVSPGGYIQGEETALLEALEGNRGEPRNKPPFPGVKGLFGKPTVINNVETLAMVPVILERGVDWWNDQGVAEYQGLKFISISGHVERPDVYCIPMGTTIREFIEMAGGMKDGMELQAILPGGASSNIISPDKIDTPMDFKAMNEIGSMMGSGAMVVIGEGVDLIEVGANISTFFRNESCGKCVPCRLGTSKGVAIVDEFLSGNCGPEKLAELNELNEVMGKTSICGLGQVALGPMVSVLKNFPDAAGERARNADTGKVS
ncbi:MAG: NADH-ubiquinone oxidoreductase-F iron-sulfur binding region domain-containing protein [Planctomycetota bacterium]|jgi:NADH:ubiquinone oxidoreductase subunit F (NADH-binding)/NADH:ubiquinone oxidoreductase subunit E|nr:NADH-ubiquinone oxidoreductase-F iron-sulfur binding region domain-containing protein [Planctomycetota bacterium]